MHTWLRADGLIVTHRASGRRLLDGLSLAFSRGERVALVGASGSGKSTTAQALLGLLSTEEFELRGRLSRHEDCGQPVALPLGRPQPAVFGAIFQDPGASLNPSLTLGEQLTETLRGLGRRAARARARSMLERVGVPDAERRLSDFPHALSGGLKQRVALSIAMLQSPAMLVADEPTTALDATVQADVLACLLWQCRQAHMGLLLITHDLAVAAHACERVIVLDGGRAAEDAPMAHFLRSPKSEAGQRLLAAARVAHVGRPRGPREPVPDGAPVLSARGLCLRVPLARSWPWQRRRHASLLRELDLELRAGEVMALVGESGSGKSTLGRALCGLLPLERGELCCSGRVQMVFQDPKASLDPRQTARAAVEEALLLAGAPAAARAAETERLLALTGLDPAHWRARATSLSGGQAQRVALARSLAVRPRVLVADEATSALDATSRGQVLDLLRRLADAEGLAVLLITHDLAAVRRVADRAMTLYLGQCVEEASARRLLQAPLHPYSRLLVGAELALAPPAPGPLPALPAAATWPSILSPPAGCPFAPRCGEAMARCSSVRPPLLRVATGRAAACHLVPAAEKGGQSGRA